MTTDELVPNGSLRVESSDLEAAFQKGKEYIEQHAPRLQDGRKKLEAAKAEARSSQRHLWVISGGPRCGPCFRLARWIEQHHQVLQKDLVIVKITGGLDESANEIGTEIGGDKHGIPFHAMMSPDGQIVVTSEGPLGNIGFPGAIEGRHHFQSMLERVRRTITADELKTLIESLAVED